MTDTHSLYPETNIQATTLKSFGKGRATTRRIHTVHNIIIPTEYNKKGQFPYKKLPFSLKLVTCLGLEPKTPTLKV